MQNIKIVDVTLNEVNNSNFTLSFKEKLEIAKKLEDLGVDTIEVTSLNGKADDVLIKTLSTCLTKTTIGYVSNFSEKGLENGFSLISGAKNKKLIIKLPVSPVNMEYTFNVKPNAVLELLETFCKKAVSLCDTEVCFDDFTRAEKSFLIKAVETAISTGVKTLSFSDQAGILEPDDFAKIFSDLYKEIPSLKNFEVLIQCSDEYKMATASIFSVIKEGVSGVKLSCININNLPDFERFILALENIGSKKGLGVSINKTSLKRVLEQISSFINSKTFIKSDEDSNIEEISDKITQADLTKLLKKRGYDLSVEDVAKIFSEVKRIEKNKNITTKDLDSIVAVTALQVPATYELLSYAVHCSNVISSSANVTLKTENGNINGIAIGNGSIDSAFLAIENAIGRTFDLDDFVVNGVTEGQQAMGETIIKLRNNGKIYSGRGVSTDIVGASIRAYINALNKIVYEENE